MVTAESFFKDMRYPPNFFRPAEPITGDFGSQVFLAHPIQAGRNNGSVNSYTVDESLGGITDLCRFYQQFVNVTVQGLYPNPTGILRTNLNINLGFLYDALGFTEEQCPRVFPYGRD